MRREIRSWLSRVDPRVEWPRGLVRFGVLTCVVAAIGLGSWYYVTALDRLGDIASQNAQANFDDREFGGGNSLAADKGALYEARALIPEDGRYRVIVGAELEGATELTVNSIDQFIRFFLMPRRPDPDAEWILCYGCDPSELAGRLDVVWKNDAGIFIGRLRG